MNNSRVIRGHVAIVMVTFYMHGLEINNKT